MRSEWKACTLDNVADIIMGQSPKGDTCNNNEIGLPLLNGPTEFGIKHPQPVQYTTDPKRVSEKGDILFCVRGSTTGRMNWSDQEYVIGRGIAAIRHKYNKEINNFVKALIDYNLQTLLSVATGSVFPNVTGDHLSKIEILLPPLPEQKAIAGVLSSLDDKIDLLHRQNKTLEGMAETLWRKMFVEDADINWQNVELEHVVDTTSGGTPSRLNMNFYNNGTIHWVKSKELNGSFIINTEEKITEFALKKSSAKILPINSILIAMYGATVGEYGIISKEMTCNQAVCALKPNENYPYTFLFLLVKFNKEELINMAVGSAQQNISQLLIKKLLVPNCTDRINEFHLIVKNHFEKIKKNTYQISSLEKLRESLLPKLMSGEVRVKL